MSKIDSNVNVSTAVRQRSKKRYEQDHVTTQCFMRPVPVFAREKPASRKIFVNHENFTRLEPMPVPTFGRAMVYNRSFFVPFRTVWRDWDRFITQSPAPDAKQGYMVMPNTPFFLNKELVNLCLESRLSSAGTSSNYDFAVKTASNTYTYHRWTADGSYFYKVMLSLGYSINFDLNDLSPQSALPFLCFCKVILDWYYPSQYAYSNVFSDVEYFFEADGLWENSILNSAARLQLFANFFDVACFCSYETDYFASAWDNPVSPNSANFEGTFSLSDVSIPSSANTVSNTGNVDRTPIIYSDDSNISQYLLDTLKSLTDYTKRHQLVGVRAVDRYLAEYGISLSSEILKRSIYTGYYSYPIQFGDVFSHSDTVGQGDGGDRLGEYAGKGQGYGGKVLGYDDPNEFGFFIVMNSIIPQVGFFQGQVRDTMHFTPLDFWHADFDKQGVQAIAQREVYVADDISQHGGMVPSIVNQNIFGYIPRYAEYHCGFDRVTGIFREKSRNLGLSSYYLQRIVPDTVNDVIDHSIGYAVGSDYQNYNRIFYTNEGWDFFTSIHHFEVSYSDEMLPLWEDYDFEDHAKSVKMNVGGSSVN